MIDLMHGDCLEKMKDIPDNSIDMVLTDPPYGTTQCKWDTVIDLDLMWKELNRIIKKDGAICIFGTQPFTSALIMSNPKMYKYDWIWHKNKSTNFLNAKKQPLRNIELISVFNKSKYFPQKTTGHKPVNSFTKNTSDGETMGKTKKGISGGGQTDRYPTQYLDFKVVNNDNKIKTHPTQKPVELLSYLVKTYSEEMDTVLDFTMGSGSTGVSCRKLNRKFIGIEKDDKYFQIARDRISKV